MTLFDLTGRIAVVTGGNGGIGLGMAKGLATAGAEVAPQQRGMLFVRQGSSSGDMGFGSRRGRAIPLVAGADRSPRLCYHIVAARLHR